MTQPCPSQAHGTMAVQRLHKSHWKVRPYDGGPYHHKLRQCSYCGGLHPDDLIAAVEAGAKIEGTDKGYKLYARVPNLVAGKWVRTGSSSGPTFRRAPTTLRERLVGPTMVTDPTLQERISGRFDRSLYDLGSPEAHVKVYLWHFTDAQRQRLADAVNAQRLKPRWRCTRPGCGKTELMARVEGCQASPCPMEPI